VVDMTDINHSIARLDPKPPVTCNVLEYISFATATEPPRISAWTLCRLKIKVLGLHYWRWQCGSMISC